MGFQKGETEHGFLHFTRCPVDLTLCLVVSLESLVKSPAQNSLTVERRQSPAAKKAEQPWLQSCWLYAQRVSLKSYPQIRTGVRGQVGSYFGLCHRHGVISDLAQN